MDRLHHDAGSRRVVELHGNLRSVSCLACRIPYPRGEVQERLEALNPGWTDRVAALAPDGDADVDWLWRAAPALPQPSPEAMRVPGTPSRAAIATMTAAVPAALGLGEGSETRTPMAIAVIGGLAVSTALSLFVVPAFYVVADAVRRRLGLGGSAAP